MVRHMARFRRRGANEGQERGGSDQNAEAGFAWGIDQGSPGPVANQDKDVQFALARHSLQAVARETAFWLDIDQFLRD